MTKRAMVLCALAACGARDDSARRTAAVTARPGDRTVTLITGDQVVMRDGTPSVTPGPGRASVRFSITRSADRVTVIPQDVRSLLARGQLDPALFEVTGLLAGGYSDASSPICH